MPIERKVSSDGLFINTTISGTLTIEELLSYEQSLASDSRIQPGFKELFDATAVTEIKITKEDLIQVAEIDKKNIVKMAGSKCAIVVSDSQAFELGTYFEELSKPNYVNVIVFNSATTAKKWLGVSDEVKA